MPRFTSVQTYSDENTKTVTGYSGDNSSASEPAKKKLVVEKVENVMGSCAGAGSGEFDVYRAQRRREFARLEAIEAEQKKEEQEKSLQERIERNTLEADERTKKNAAKRNKKKQRREELKRKYESIVTESTSRCEEEKSSNCESPAISSV